MSEAHPQATFDWTVFEGPSMAVVAAVAEESDENPGALLPIYEVVDPDSLDTIFAEDSESTRISTGSIQFEYHGYSVIVKANGRGYLYEQGDVHNETPPSEPPKTKEHD